jgi:hypothetical protein
MVVYVDKFVNIYKRDGVAKSYSRRQTEKKVEVCNVEIGDVRIEVKC